MQKTISNDVKTAETLAKMKHKILVLSGKGGMGKSIVAAHLASALAEKKYNVGLLDCDIHGPSIPKILGIEQNKPSVSEQRIQPVEVGPNLKVMSLSFFLPSDDSPIIWRGPVKMGAIKQFVSDVNWGTLDYLIVDLPPGSCGTAKERVETKEEGKYCLDWFICLKKDKLK
jgi:ATP-binding protein involved in chromosome partitioning